jgi:hypothetical protein
MNEDENPDSFTISAVVFDVPLPFSYCAALTWN